MRKSLKIATVAAVLFLAMGAIVLVYANSQNGFNADSEEQTQMSIQNMQAFFGSCNASNVTMPGHMMRMPHMRANDLPWSEGLLQNATLSTIQGTVVSEFRDILILDAGSGQTRVLLPKGWTLDNEVVGRVGLFNGTFASPGQSVTLKVMESDVISNTSFSINIMMGYEAINATGTHAYAVIPFNIQPGS